MEQTVPREPRFTYREYAAWSDEERWELIDGIAYNMTPAPSTEHQRLSFLLTIQIGEFLRGKKCELFYAPFDVRLPEGDESDEDIRDVVQPDIAVICDPAKIDKKGCRGAPDFIVEILSPRTSSKDSNEKRELYERRGVRAYWLADPVARTVAVLILGSDGRYGEPSVQPLRGKTAVSLFPGLAVDWDS